jgi:hypothetical protein
MTSPGIACVRTYATDFAMVNRVVLCCVRPAELPDRRRAESHHSVVGRPINPRQRISPARIAALRTPKLQPAQLSTDYERRAKTSWSQLMIEIHHPSEAIVTPCLPAMTRLTPSESESIKTC